jgi:multiple sugar transport system ATP-binding protein
VSRLELRGIGKQFGKNRALDQLDLEIGPGEIIGMTGPSGAGKTTTCRLAAGLEFPSEGEVCFDGKNSNSLPTQDRNVAFMFESYALYPHFTVLDNITFPLRAPKHRNRYRPEEIERRAAELIQGVEIEGLENRFPNELSGGQRQRVALCRTLIQEPRVYLLDEPISHLDAKLSYRLRGEIRRRLIQTETPTLWTTPNALEALSIADRVVVLVSGRVQQVGPPQEIYRQPANTEVARLVGDPPINLLTGTIGSENGALFFQHDAFRLRLSDTLKSDLEARAKGEKITLGIRPTEIHVLEGPGEGHAGEVYVFEPFGKYIVLSVRLGEDVIKVKTSHLRLYQPGEKVRLQFEQPNLLAFDPTAGNRVL